MATRPFMACSAALLAPAVVQAQSEAALRDYFEGRTVKVKLAMPGTEDGVDIYPGTAKPLDYPRHAGRLKSNGTALRAGDDALVTKVKVKSNLIEFQLDGGGYGTMGDETSSSVGVSEPRRPSASRISRASSSGSRIPPGGARSRKSSTTSRPSASGRSAEPRVGRRSGGVQEGQHPPAAARGRLPVQHPLQGRRARRRRSRPRP